MPNFADKVVKKTLAGTSRADSDYRNWSGGCDLWEAPEYMITTSIAKNIASLTSICVTLEQPIYDFVNDRPRNQERLDIAVYRKGEPVGVVEVKKNPLNFAGVCEDVNRICAILAQDNRIEFGLIAIYVSSGRRNENPANRVVEERLGQLVQETCKFVANKPNLHLTSHRSPIVTLHYENDVDLAWTSMVFKLEPPAK